MIDNKTIRKVIMLNKLLPSGSPVYENREASGAIANFTTNTVKPFVKCECTIDATESGTSVLNVEKRGVNLFDEDLEEGWLNQTTGEPQEYSNRMRSKNFCSIVPNQVYYIKCGNNEEAYWYFYDSNKTYLRRRLIRNNTTTTQADECFFKVGIVGISSYSDNISLNYPSTDTSYHAYTGTTTTVTLEETAYGGRVDVISGLGQIIDKYGDTVYTAFEPVSISALEGVNNVWTDVGNTKVTYKYMTGEGGSTKKKYLPIFYDMYGKEKYYHGHS